MLCVTQSDFLLRLLNDNTLQRLILEPQKIGDAGVKAIAEELKHNTRWQELDLSASYTTSGGSHNNIGDEGAKALTDALKQNKTLRRLYLAHNNIGDEGAKAIAEVLKHNKSLHKLYLSSNNIGVEGAKAIADALKHNHTLQHLDLRWNKFGDEGCKSIKDSLLYHNTTILSCWLLFMCDTRLITRKNKLFRHLPQQTNDLAAALWSFIGADVYTLLLVLDKCPHVARVPQYRKVELLQRAVDCMAGKEPEVAE